MSNDYYNHGTYPVYGAQSSPTLDGAEWDKIATGFAKLPALAGNGYKIVYVNAAGTALTVSSSVLFDVSGNLFVATAAAGTATTQVASTAFVASAGLSSALPGQVGNDGKSIVTAAGVASWGVSGAVGGGTGQSSYAVGDILYASTTTALSKLAASTAGYVLTSGGAGVAPVYADPMLTAASGGTVDAITATFAPALTLRDQQKCFVVCAGANTSATPTFAPNSLTAHTITMNGGQPLVAGSIPAAGFVAILEYNLANTRWELLNPKPSSVSAATQAQMEAITSNTVMVTPLSANWHPGVAKCWIKCDGSSAAITASYNITSTTDTGTGVLTVTIATDFSSAEYAIATIGTDIRVITVGDGGSAQTAGAFVLHSFTVASGASDPVFYNAICFGDQ